MNTEKTNIPGWFWIVGVLALIWNIFGALAYVGQAMAGPEMLEAMPEDQRLMIENRPPWATAAFAFAVWGGTLGAILLLMRKSLAEIVLIISLVGILVQMTYNLFVAEQTLEYSATNVAITIVIPVFGLLLIWVARRAKANGWMK